jgi:hypothetical protein
MQRINEDAIHRALAEYPILTRATGFCATPGSSASAPDTDTEKLIPCGVVALLLQAGVPKHEIVSYINGATYTEKEAVTMTAGCSADDLWKYFGGILRDWYGFNDRNQVQIVQQANDKPTCEYEDSLPDGQFDEASTALQKRAMFLAIRTINRLVSEHRYFNTESTPRHIAEDFKPLAHGSRD